MSIVFKKRCNSVVLIIASALFFTFFQNTLFFSKTLEIISANSLRDVLFLATMPLLLFCLLNIIFSLLLWPYIRKPILIIFLLAGAAVNYFMYSFNIVIDSNMIENAVQTNVHETMDLLTPGMIAWITFAGIIPSLFVVTIKIQSPYSWLRLLGLRVANIIISAIIVVLIALGFFKDYASFIRNNKPMVEVLVPSNFVSGTIKVLSHHLSVKPPYKTLGTDAKLASSNLAQSKKTLTVLVVGETARAENFSLGGYARDTNPKLSKRNNLFYFENVSSCGTATAVSVPCMFSNMTKSQYDAKKAKNQDDVLDIIARAGVNVLWRENDGGCKGVCERVNSEDMTDLKLPEYCKDGACLDEILLHNLQQYIDSKTGNILIVLHQMGSHGPTYFQRYSDEFRHFTPTCDTNQIQDCDTQKLVNTYDNTIAYTDMLLDKIIELLQTQSDKYATAMVYLSDHGESLGENGVYLHGTPYAMAPSQQTHIPLLMWLSEDYQQYRSIKKECLKQEAKTSSFSHDNLFHSLLGIFDVQTSEYNPQLDILYPCR